MYSDAPVGTVELGNLPAIWEVLDALEGQMDTANAQYPRTNLLCDRRFDEAKHVGERTYILAHSSIMAARDSHQAFLKALQYDGVRAQASWGMIRPSFESAFYAVWMLQPENSRTRLQRGLRVVWEQHRTHHLRLDIMKQLAAEHDIPANHPDLLQLAQTKREHEVMYDAEAASIGLSHQQMTANVNLTNELDKLSYGDEVPGWIGKWFHADLAAAVRRHPWRHWGIGRCLGHRVSSEDPRWMDGPDQHQRRLVPISLLRLRPSPDAGHEPPRKPLHPARVTERRGTLPRSTSPVSTARGD